MLSGRLKDLCYKALPGVTRRDLFRSGGLAAAAGLLRGASQQPTTPEGAGLRIGPNIYQSIGVRPVINCKGTFTIISGSLSLPEVKQAEDEASRHYVHLDELMDGVGRRLAELTGAEYGIVTAGCAAALTHATSACIAGADPEKLQRLPNLQGLKNEVIIPRYSRNVYDHAVRMLGVRIVEADNIEEFEAAFTERTAMVMVLAGPGDDGPLGTEPICRIARRKNVPVIVDAAAERLTIPNLHLGRGAHMVAYSGGKCLRGPQCAGLLLGQKDLLRAAWLHSAPHHAFGRSLKVGKEEIMGMLAAVEMWVKRDHKAEWKEWETWLDRIASEVTKVEGVTTEVLQPQGLSNNAPRLRIAWDGAKLGITGKEIADVLWNQEPRIILGEASGDSHDDMASAAVIMPYMMMPGDDKVVAGQLRELLAHPPKVERTPYPMDSPLQVAGQWDARVEFFLGTGEHSLVFEQDGGKLVGTHRGDILSGELRGRVDGNEIRFRSSMPYEGTRLSYRFEGKIDGDAMRGTVSMDEYGVANWTAQRHTYRLPGGVTRPLKNV
ncbi:MAG: hypothetical protein ABFD89_07880 [Bryobacteraceae bacterium]